MSNPIVFFEIGCKDSPSTIDFYRDLFDWELSPTPTGAAINPGEGIRGQINCLGHEPHQYTMFYVQVDDVAVAIQRVVQLGGVALVGPITIPNGTFGWVQDPGGNTIGLWKPA